mmetsp:Transcript_5049/g.10628  ORF Transcript_5049/g.10628 Transcript_5049/m.10628 type:complete len:86 (+) Transcript_5049:1071-1328(+)
MWRDRLLGLDYEEMVARGDDIVDGAVLFVVSAAFNEHCCLPAFQVCREQSCFSTASSLFLQKQPSPAARQQLVKKHSRQKEHGRT